jgi:hypothetical protein
MAPTKKSPIFIKYADKLKTRKTLKKKKLKMQLEKTLFRKQMMKKKGKENRERSLIQRVSMMELPPDPFMTPDDFSVIKSSIHANSKSKQTSTPTTQRRTLTNIYAKSASADKTSKSKKTRLLSNIYANKGTSKKVFKSSSANEIVKSKSTYTPKPTDIKRGKSLGNLLIPSAFKTYKLPAWAYKIQGKRLIKKTDSMTIRRIKNLGD